MKHNYVGEISSYNSQMYINTINRYYTVLPQKVQHFGFTSHEGKDPVDSQTGNRPEVAVNNALTGTSMHKWILSQIIGIVLEISFIRTT